MTTTTYSSAPTQGNDALFRALWSPLSSALQTVGLVKTSDTGQANWATITLPGSVNTSSGYEIYRFNDSLQSTCPIFLKIEYGSGSSLGYPSIWITIGTGSDGAGTITGTLFSRTQIACNNLNAGAYPSRVTGSVNRFCFVLWIGQSVANLVFCLERTHNTAGADTSDGVIVFFNSATGTPSSQCIPFTGASGNLYAHWNSTLPPSGTGVKNTDVYLFPVRTWGPGETCPSLQLFLYFGADLTAQNVVNTTLWDGSSGAVLPTAVSIAAFYYGGAGSLAIRAD